jgi:hypothetical protein
MSGLVRHDGYLVGQMLIFRWFEGPTLINVSLITLEEQNQGVWNLMASCWRPIAGVGGGNPRS